MYNIIYFSNNIKPINSEKNWNLRSGTLREKFGNVGNEFGGGTFGKKLEIVGNTSCMGQSESEFFSKKKNYLIHEEHPKQTFRRVSLDAAPISPLLPYSLPRGWHVSIEDIAMGLSTIESGLGNGKRERKSFLSFSFAWRHLSCRHVTREMVLCERKG